MDFAGKVAYELSTYGSTLTWLRRNFSQVITSEYFQDRPLGQTVEGVMNQDVQRLTFPDSSLDLVSSNQVFEHVPDDILGFAESHRVLKPGGAMVLSVPLYPLPSTQRIASIVNSKVFFVGEPEYHDSRIGGAQSAPVFWRHSVSDVRDRVRSVGFQSVKLVDVVIAKGQQQPTKVIYAIK